MPEPTCRILIADGHEAIRTGIRTFLESRESWQIAAEASNGLDALRLARETSPDVAILPYSLPRMNGLELTLAIRRELPRTEVLIYTMHHKARIVDEVLRAGARGYVLKTDPATELINGVEALAKGKTYLSVAVCETMLSHGPAHHDGKANNHRLTSRERQVVQLIAEGKLNKQVAHLLDISVKTVETHRAAVMQKLRCRTTAELVRYAVRSDMVQP